MKAKLFAAGILCGIGVFLCIGASISPIGSFDTTANYTVTGNWTGTGTWDLSAATLSLGTISDLGTPGAGVLSNCTSATNTANSGDTKVATDAYADNSGKAGHLGTFASPNTAAGAITWTNPVYEVFTSAAAATRTYTLPAASSYTGMAVIIYVSAGTNHVNVQPASGAQLVLGGTLLTADHYIQAATSAASNYICMISDGTNWVSLGQSGTWADAASP